ncbi:hypothetical protein V8C43DRAFT_319451 [Trichoderma afarasin]
MRSLLAGASVLLLVASKGASNAIPDATSAHELVQRDQIYHAKNGNNFAVESGFDYHGGDYKTITANTFYDCIDACATQPACRAVSFSGKSCYLKSSVNAATANNKVSGAVRVQYLSAPIICPADGSNQVKAIDGRRFTIQCGVDHPHGDITSVLTLDFPNCINLCDKTQGPSTQQIKEPSGRNFTIACDTDYPGGDLTNKLLNSFGDCIAWCDEITGCRTKQQTLADVSTYYICLGIQQHIHGFWKFQDDISQHYCYLYLSSRLANNWLHYCSGSSSDQSQPALC